MKKPMPAKKPSAKGMKKPDKMSMPMKTMAKEMMKAKGA